MVQGDVLKISLLIYSLSVAAILNSSLEYFEMDARRTKRGRRELPDGNDRLTKESNAAAAQNKRRKFFDNIERDNEVKIEIRKVYNNERV